MISAREASEGLFGAWLLARFDEDGIRYFDNTPEAAFNSFKTAILALPMQLGIMLLQSDWSAVAVGVFGATLILVVTFIADWTAFPLAMFYVARASGRDHVYWRYIAAYNWARVLQNALYLAVAAIVASGALPMWLAGFATFATLIAIFVYKGYIARVGLEVAGFGTVGIVLLDLLISALFSWMMLNMLRGHHLLGG